ncbi:fructoselysine 6-phosphate deglycase [Escherichia coli]|nr:fructoselysine 6-phosphate deglycase [Escherichia coli]EEU4567900.1 fructoselysine 6-phosphate deglycase [Escherichia coli]EGV0660776.1 fructoselysine 6-phosphate deglycase [Escherichia coli]EHX2921920.1 fructoselysine 6-phosphate deglycase [Escherichia coli]EIB7654729.1 fructoselysine 6-phosphate deglycase [Escherichia coli]
MLDIDKSTVDFLVTENMVQEVEKVLSHDVPLVHTIVEEMVKRDIDRIYFVACGSPLNAAQTAKHLADRFSDLQVYAISGWEFCDNTPYRLDDRCAVIGVSDYGKTEEVIKALELGRACGALTAAFTKRADSPITSAAEFSIDYQADCIWEIHLLLCYSVVLEMITRLAPNAEIGKIKNDLKQLPNALGHLVRTWEEKGRQHGELASQWPMIYTVAAGPLRPLEIVEPGVPFLFLLGNDESRHTTERAINFVKQRTDNVIVIDYAEISQGLHPWLAPFLMFVPMEWLCYYLSIYKDHNPDERRYYGGLVEY